VIRLNGLDREAAAFPCRRRSRVLRQRDNKAWMFANNSIVDELMNPGL
jgi:hypothetical protein